MQTSDAAEISLEELAQTLETYAGRGTAQRSRRPHGRNPWRVGILVASVALLLVGGSFAAGVGPFAGISAANHAGTPTDTLPAPLTTHLAEFSSAMERSGHGHLLLDTARLVTELPGGARFYTVATSAGGLCLANVNHSGDTQAGVQCGDALNDDRPITIASERTNSSTPPVSYGLAIDGVTSVSFTSSGAVTTVPVKDNVWAYEGDVNLTSASVHWDDGRTQMLINGR